MEVSKKIIMDHRGSIILAGNSHPELAKSVARYVTKVSLLGVVALLGDCKFIPADWGSYVE